MWHSGKSKTMEIVEGPLTSTHTEPGWYLLWLMKLCCHIVIIQSSYFTLWFTLGAVYSMGLEWNSPGQNTGVGSLSLLQGIFPTQGSNPGQSTCIADRFFTSWVTREAIDHSIWLMKLCCLIIIWCTFTWNYIIVPHVSKCFLYFHFNDYSHTTVN